MSITLSPNANGIYAHGPLVGGQRISYVKVDGKIVARLEQVREEYAGPVKSVLFKGEKSKKKLGTKETEMFGFADADKAILRNWVASLVG